MTDEVFLTGPGELVVISPAVETELVFGGTVPDEVVLTNLELGMQGPPGIGVAAGGSTGDVLVKRSDGDYDTDWTPLGTLGGDKTFTQDFNPASSVTVTHNLNKYPAVTVRTSAGDVVIADIEYLSLNQVQLSFASAFGGSVICN